MITTNHHENPHENPHGVRPHPLQGGAALRSWKRSKGKLSAQDSQDGRKTSLVGKFPGTKCHGFTGEILWKKNGDDYWWFMNLTRIFHGTNIKSWKINMVNSPWIFQYLIKQKSPCWDDVCPFSYLQCHVWWHWRVSCFFFFNNQLGLPMFFGMALLKHWGRNKNSSIYDIYIAKTQKIWFGDILW